jgi:hypothetical protein
VFDITRSSIERSDFDVWQDATKQSTLWSSIERSGFDVWRKTQRNNQRCGFQPMDYNATTNVAAFFL